MVDVEIGDEGRMLGEFVLDYFRFINIVLWGKQPKMAKKCGSLRAAVTLPIYGGKIGIYLKKP